MYVYNAYTCSAICTHFSSACPAPGPARAAPRARPPQSHSFFVPAASYLGHMHSVGRSHDVSMRLNV